MLPSSLKFILLISCCLYHIQAQGILDSGAVQLVKFGSKSYYFSYDFQANWYQATQVCGELGLRLVTIPSKEVNDFLYQNINAKTNAPFRYWTSGTNLVDGKNWAWISNAQPVVYNNWNSGQPDLVAERCIELLLFKNVGLVWNNLDCNIQLNIICETPDVDEKGVKIKASKWVQLFNDPLVSPYYPTFNYNKNTYYVGNQVALPYYDAERFCKLIGLDLVYIESKEENQIIYKYIRDTIAGVSFWTGGNNLLDAINWYWFPSGRKVFYTNWLVGKPISKVQNCIQLQFQKDVGLFWNDLSCVVPQNFICKSVTAKCPFIDPACHKRNLYSHKSSQEISGNDQNCCHQTPLVN